jgi:polysaccharide export outer membrane protein
MRTLGRRLFPALVVLVMTAVFLIPETACAQPNDYRIGPDDVLDVVVWDNIALSRTVPVRPDGRISLPLLNDVMVAGLTPMELRKELVSRLALYTPAPEVSVIVREVHSFKVSVVGQVKTPGRYDLKGRTTVLDLLATAGPFTDFAAPRRIFVIRTNELGSARIPFNYDKVVAGEAKHANFVLQPGDIVVVP